MKIHHLLIPACFCNLARAAELPFPIYDPTDSSPREAAGSLKPEISESVKILIAHLKEPKDFGFIGTPAAVETKLKWHVEKLIVLTENVVSVEFSEGHISVIGIYVRDDKRKRWELKSGIHGTFRDMFFEDPRDAE